VFASVADVGTALMRPLTEAESAAATQWLAYVEARVRLRFPDLVGRVAASPDLAVIAQSVVAGAVARGLRNPEGKLSESIDDYSYRRTETAAAGLDLTDLEWDLLAPPATSGGSGAAFTVRPYGAPDVAGRFW